MEPQSSEDLYCWFRDLKGHQEEKRPEFLTRFQQLLMRVTLKKGIQLERVNQAQITLVSRGTLFADIILLNLHGKRLEDPPSFLVLFKEVREEENREAVKKDPVLKTKAVAPKSPGEGVSPWEKGGSHPT